MQSSKYLSDPDNDYLHDKKLIKLFLKKYNNYYV